MTRPARSAARPTPRSGAKRSRSPQSQPTLTHATLTAWSPGEPLLITLERPGAVPQAAETLVAFNGAALKALVAARARVMVSFVDGDPATPVVVGVLQALPTRVELDLPLGAPEHARVDGRRVTLTGKDEIELKCGQASITLRRNGRMVLRGTAVETAASGVNRIKGGMVRIN